MKLQRSLRTTIGVSAAALAAATGVMASSGSASAGSNGQQVRVSTYYSDYARVCGVNQHGVHVCTPWFDTPGSGYHGQTGWWFKGRTTIEGVNADNGQHRKVTISVPVSQSGDWVSYNGRSSRTL
ncbi:hypothetical protein ACFH04_09845 [Streptomyces noboritoensis]|uniref:Secreted protein n=1 Tax=Streptomyces noboritoensis TaxID=67337 RepID=A0ABV6THP2_9ACTN